MTVLFLLFQSLCLFIYFSYLALLVVTSFMLAEAVIVAFLISF